MQNIDVHVNTKKSIESGCKACQFYKDGLEQNFYLGSRRCFNCIVDGVIDSAINNLDSTIYYIPEHDISIFKSIGDIILKFKKYLFKRREKCRQQECLLDIDSYGIFNLIYNFLSRKIIVIEDNSSSCNKCVKFILNKVIHFIYRQYPELGKKLSMVDSLNGKDLTSILSLIFKGWEIPELGLDGDGRILEEYFIDNLNLFKASIIDSESVEGIIYKVTPEIIFNNRRFYTFVTGYLGDNYTSISDDKIAFGLQDFLEDFIRYSEYILRKEFKNIEESLIKKIAFYAAIKYINMDKLFPLLLDNNIEEIFCDGPRTRIYLDHRKYGRCITPYYLLGKDIDAIKSFIRLESNKRLDYTSPSIKWVIKNKFFYCRFTIDVNPVVSTGFALDIRKMNRRIFTLPELIALGTLSSEIAAFLYYALLNKLNITVVGETNTGKTTLINALDILVPVQFRKIYVEDAEESLNLMKFGIHQLKFIIDPDSTVGSIKSKSSEIYRLLHRTPDIVYLGEILNEDEAKAMFHCLSAGLKGFQTIHAPSLDGILNRWIYHFGIDPSCLNDLDILIIMKKLFNRRLVFEIWEVGYRQNKIIKKPIFRYNPDIDSWENLTPYRNLTVFNRIPMKSIMREQISYEISVYRRIFEYFIDHRIFDIEVLLPLIKEMNFYILSIKKSGGVPLFDDLLFYLIESKKEKGEL